MSLSVTHTHPPMDSSNGNSSKRETIPNSRYRLVQASELMRDIRLAQSLVQLIHVLTHTLPGLLDARASGYLTWVTSPRTGVHWESVSGERGTAFKEAPLAIDVSSANLLKSGQHQMVTRQMEDVPNSLNKFMEAAGMVSLQILPIFLENAVRGVIVLGRDEGQSSWKQAELDAALEVVQLAMTVYAMRNELAQTEQHLKELERVFLASLDLTATLDLEDVLNSILKNALALFPDANDAHIYYYDGENLSFGAALFKDGTNGNGWVPSHEDKLTLAAAQTGNMIVVENIRKHPLYTSAPDNWTGGMVAIPLKMKGTVTGVMTLAVPMPYVFQESRLHQLRLLADQAAIAIQNAQLHNLIRVEAQTDWLTGLPNRRAFEVAIEQMIGHAAAISGTFTVMMLDLDHFKSINDSYGHRIGDEALKRIANRLHEAVRKTDFIARLGGDEFAILFPATSKEEAYVIGTQLQEFVSVCDLQLPDGKLGCISISFGLANYPDSATTALDLLEAADTGLYLDKDRG